MPCPQFLQPAIEAQRVQATAQTGAAPALAMMEEFAAFSPTEMEDLCDMTDTM
jgi:hypothetical protein